MLLAAALAGMAAQQFDAAAEHRMATLRDVQALLAQLQPWVPPALQAAVDAARTAAPASLRLSDLDTALAPALRALTDLHAHLELQPGPGARDEERACLDGWDRMSHRRQLVLGA